jgi:hypothetical protein
MSNFRKKIVIKKFIDEERCPSNLTPDHNP